MATILITGCSSGFGMASALAFARNGDRVYASMRDTGKAGPLQRAADQEDLKIHIITLDVTRPATFEKAITEIVGEAGRIDVLVNNAGILRVGAFEDLTEQAIREVMETNFFGVQGRVLHAAGGTDVGTEILHASVPRMGKICI